MIGLIDRPTRRRAALVALSIVFIVSASVIVAYSAFAPFDGVRLAAGQVAPTDILAPRSITYDSDALTRLSRQAAGDAVREVFDPPNPGILRQQIQLARHVLDYINNVRHDDYATIAQQRSDLAAITTLRLSSDVAPKLLNVSDDSWKTVDDQVMILLERTMRDEIREGNLLAVYANLPNRVSITVDETQTTLILAMVKDLIKPNTFYNEERTRAARQEAAAKVAPETRSFAQGQIVVRAGTIVTEADIEALAQLKLLQPTDRRLQTLTGAFLAVLLITLFGSIYLRRFHIELVLDVSQLILIAGLFLFFLAGSRIFGTSNEFQAHLYPTAALSLLVVALTSPQVAIGVTIALALLIGLIMGGSLEFATLVAVSGVAGALSLNRVERMNAYFRAGLVISVANIAVGLLFFLLQEPGEPIRVVTVLFAGMLNGVISAGLAIVGLYLISTALNVPTTVRLLELSQPNQPLLQRLLREAPGTYQHSLQVANLAELAAERIGANPLLTRVGALYHDVGKTVYPHFFVENQAEGVNPHDELNDPQRSAQIIISHVFEGEKLARKYRLSPILIDFIRQHHGTTPVLYFYNKALEAVNCDVTCLDKEAFCYPGPCPQTREAAILMLADSSESVVRAKHPRTKQEIEVIIGELIQLRIASGQLDHSHLTVNDLKILQESFVSSLQGVFHPRIVYPPTPTPIAVPALPEPSTPALTPPHEIHP